MTTGEKIAEQRKLHKMSQADLAEKVGVTRSVIIKWESDVYCPSPVNADKLSNLFGVPFCYLFDECACAADCKDDCFSDGLCLLREINAATALALERRKKADVLRKRRGIIALLAVLLAQGVFATACIGIIVFAPHPENTSTYVTNSVVSLPHFIMSLILSLALAAAIIVFVLYCENPKNAKKRAKS